MFYVMFKRRDMEFKEKMHISIQGSSYPHMKKDDQEKIRRSIRIEGKKKKMTAQEERDALLKLKDALK